MMYIVYRHAVSRNEYISDFAQTRKYVFVHVNEHPSGCGVSFGARQVMTPTFLPSPLSFSLEACLLRRGGCGCGVSHEMVDWAVWKLSFEVFSASF